MVCCRDVIVVPRVAGYYNVLLTPNVNTPMNTKARNNNLLGVLAYAISVVISLSLVYVFGLTALLWMGIGVVVLLMMCWYW